MVVKRGLLWLNQNTRGVSILPCVVNVTMFLRHHPNLGLITNGAELVHLATLPQHQRRGVGTGLLKWGIAEAGGKWETSRIQATEVGLSLYGRSDWNEVD